MLINLEGIDGSGKTQLGQALAEVLPAKYLHYPNDEGFTGPIIRDYLRGKWRINHDEGFGKAYDALAFQALQTVNRIENIQEMNRYRGSPQEHMVLDRYWPSCLVYGQLDGISADWLAQQQTVLPSADLYVLLECAPQVALERLKSKGSSELYEKIGSLEKATQLFQEVWNSGASNPNWIRVDAHQDTATMVQQVVGWVEHGN